MKIEHKRLGVVTKTENVQTAAGVQVGIVEGYIATWDIDRGDHTGIRDQFVKGAFADSIKYHRERGRPIRLKDHHGRTVGGFPIGSVHEDDRGLWGRGEINLEVQQGREAYALAAQGVLTDFSIGFTPVDFTIDRGVRTITKAVIWEGSVVDEPMNPHANIVAVKSAVPFQDLPLAPEGREWDEEGAKARVAQVDPKAAHLWYDPENEGSYKFLIADVIDDKLHAVPAAIAVAARAVSSGAGIPEADRPAVIAHIERYYEKMGRESPFVRKSSHTIDDVRSWTPRDVERALRATGAFSRSAAKALASRIGHVAPKGVDEMDLIVKALQDLHRDIS